MKERARGQWHGRGTRSIAAYPAPGERRPSHAYFGYWWYLHADGVAGATEYCEHAHRSHEAAVACGEKEARVRNKALERVRGRLPSAEPAGG